MFNWLKRPKAPQTTLQGVLASDRETARLYEKAQSTIKQDPSSALAAARSCSEKHPEIIEFSNLRAAAALNCQEFAEATESWLLCLERDPQHADAINFLSAAAVSVPSRHDEVEQAYRRAFAQTADKPRLARILGKFLKSRGKLEEALVLYQEQLALFPDSLPLLNDRGAVYSLLRRWPEAEADLTRVYAAPRFDPASHFPVQPYLSLFLVEPTGAEAAFARVEALVAEAATDPPMVRMVKSLARIEARFSRGCLHYSQGEWQAAFEVFQSLDSSSLQGLSPAFHDELVAHRALARYKSGGHWSDLGEMQGPGCREARAELLMAQSRWSEAEPLLAQLAQERPDSVCVVLLQAQAKAGQGQAAEAAQLKERARDLVARGHRSFWGFQRPLLA